MANSKANPSSFIPSGEMIRDLANQTYISESDIKVILRQRGIFTPSNQKERTVAILSCLLLSPPEFELLVERQTIKEDNLKSAGSGKINLNDDFISLGSFIHEEFLPGLVKAISPKNSYLRDNYKVVGIPSVKTIQKDKHIDIEIDIERNNYNKAWVNHKSQFKAIISFKQEGKQLTFHRFFTSNETKTVVNKSISYFEKKCKEKGVIDKEELEYRIRFDDFNNEGRISFFLKLFNSKEARVQKLEGDNVESFEFCPEETLSLPDDLKWMNDKQELIFKGRRVETTFFLNEKEYYPNIVAWRMQATFKFSIIEKGVEGKVKVDFNFHEYKRDKSHKAPLEINLASALELNNPNITISQKESLKKLLLSKFEELKNSVFENYFKTLI